MPTTHRFRPKKRDVPDGRTNEDRANTAAFAVAGACNARGERGQTASEDSIRDLLADLGHLCDREGVDFEAVMRTATADWRAER